MLPLFVLLIIVPFLTGYLIRQLLKLHGFPCSAFCFALGFLVMAAEFALICYPAIYLDTPFHIVCRIVSGIYIIECAAILVWIFLTKKSSVRKWFDRDRLLSVLRSPAFWIMILICGFQIARLIVLEPYQMRDSKTYNALVVDILQSDHLFRIYHPTGFPIESILEIKPKFILSPWYPFISMLAKISGIHPLIISNTVLPAYILLMSYVVLFALGYYLFNKTYSPACSFTALCALIREVTLYCHTPTMIALVWPIWGKGALALTVVPAILVLYMLYVDESSGINSVWFCLILLLLVTAGCSMSTMGALVLPMELGILGLIETVRHRSVRSLVCSVISCIPAALYLAVYYYLSTLQV